MDDSNKGNREIQFDRLNWLGKAVFVSGQLARMAGSVLETAVDTAAGLIAETERAFRDGMDPRIEDAKILEEIEEDRRKKKKPRPQ